MPGKIWSFLDDGVLSSRIETRGRSTGSPASYALADRLDRRIDRALDEAARLRSQLENPDVPEAFTGAWAVGRALHSTGVLEDPALEGEHAGFIWEVMAAKAATRVRSDGSEERGWADLRPALDPGRPTARQGSRKGDDYWSMCVWLAEQEYGDATRTFGGSIRNVWQMLDRPTLKPPVLRSALCTWLADLLPAEADRVTGTKVFPELMKALGHRWPARGQRSALQPIHYSVDELVAEIARTVDLGDLFADR